MNNAKYIYTLFGLSLLGTVFSGYLSGVKFFTKTCAFGEGCPLFLGYPACYFGFLLFFTLLVVIVLGVFQKVAYKKVSKIMSMVSAVGVLFAGKYVLEEIVRIFSEGFTATILGLPTCAYGLVFFVLVCITSVLFNKKLQ
jgi:uncharacterized membrane protein